MSHIPWISSDETKLAVLVDPEKYFQLSAYYRDVINHGLTDIILVGGSTLDHPIVPEVIKDIRSKCKSTVVLFPGGANQLAPGADSLLLPSLISSDSLDLILGEHIRSIRQLESLKIPIYSCGYIMIDGGRMSSTEKATGQKPIAPDNTDAIIDIAKTAEMIGWKSIYLEAGSGAKHTVTSDIIKRVKKQIQIPLIVGGGIKNIKQLRTILKSNADLIVVGNALEENPSLLFDMVDAITDQVYHTSATI